MNYALIGALLASCNTDELCYSHPHDGTVRICFDWSDAPEADPALMRVWFYPTNGDSAFPVDMSPGGEWVRVGEGIYHLIAHNSDRESHNFFFTDDYDRHGLTTDGCDILAPLFGPMIRSSLRGDDDEDVMFSVDPVWVARVRDLHIAGGDVVTLRPQTFCCHYTFEFRNVGPVEHVDKLSASISGMAGAVILSTGELSNTPVTLAVDAHTGGRQRANSITGEFYTFGHHPDVDAPHKMALYVVFDNGQKVKFTAGDNLDVTDQIHSAPDPRNVHIVVEGITLPEPMESGGGGFGPSVDDWGTEDIEIKM